MPVSVAARRRGRSPAATRSRPMSPPRASSRRRPLPPTLRACGAPAGYIRAGDAVELLFPAPTPRPPALGKPRRAGPAASFREVGVERWHSRLIVAYRRCWKRRAWRARPGTRRCDGSRPSRRGPPRQLHADWGFREEDADWGRQIRNSKFEISAGGRHS